MSASIQLAQITVVCVWFKINFREKIWKGIFYLQWKEQQARSEFHMYIIRNAFSQTHRRIGEWLVVHNNYFEPVIQPVSFTAFFLDTSTLIFRWPCLFASPFWYIIIICVVFTKTDIIVATISAQFLAVKHTFKTLFLCQLLLRFWSLILSVVAE